jgi:hypothetical protein
MKHWVHFRLQSCFHNLLCDSIRYSGNSQASLLSPSRCYHLWLLR